MRIKGKGLVKPAPKPSLASLTRPNSYEIRHFRLNAVHALKLPRRVGDESSSNLSFNHYCTTVYAQQLASFDSQHMSQETNRGLTSPSTSTAPPCTTPCLGDNASRACSSTHDQCSALRPSQAGHRWWRTFPCARNGMT